MGQCGVKNWRFLYKLGIQECQWLKASETISRCARWPLSARWRPPYRRIPGRPHLENPFSRPAYHRPQVTKAAFEGLDVHSIPRVRARIREQFAMMFAARASTPAATSPGLILNRLGHAYSARSRVSSSGEDGKPAPGEVRSTPFGRIASPTPMSPDHGPPRVHPWKRIARWVQALERIFSVVEAARSLLPPEGS